MEMAPYCYILLNLLVGCYLFNYTRRSRCLSSILLSTGFACYLIDDTFHLQNNLRRNVQNLSGVIGENWGYWFS